MSNFIMLKRLAEIRFVAKMRYLNKALFSVLVYLFIYASSNPAFALTNTFELPVNINDSTASHPSEIINILPINDDVLSLMTMLKAPVNDNTVTKLDKILLTKPSLNFAEQYLVLVAQAFVMSKHPNVKKLSLDNMKVITLLEQAETLSSNISDKQLSEPDFLQMHMILAERYAAEAKYDLAYLETEHYLKKYHRYRKDKHISMLASIEKSFEVENKKASNALLKSQNELKVRHVAKVNDERDTKQYNFTIIISTAILFVLLFFRQLKVRNKLIKLTRTDALTKVANRSALFEQGTVLVKTFSKQPQDLSVLLLDVDHFKKINDNFGHNIGDRVLVIISELIQETMRSRDVFARLGGEEFVALLPYADTHKAKAIAVRINEKIAAYDFSSIMLQKRVTISIGVATLISDKMVFDDLLHCADLAMYQAKEHGRNSVVCYEEISVAQERRVKAQ